MKRVEKAPTKEDVFESLQNDEIGRNEDVARLLSDLADTEGPYTLLIDASWGDGKTFFVRSVELVLRSANQKLSEPIEGARVALSGFCDLLGDTSFLPFYFNAWENDFCDSPLAALLACMAFSFGDYGAKDNEMGAQLSRLCDTSSRAFGRMRVVGDDACFEHDAESLIATFRALLASDKSDHAQVR